MRKRRKKVRRGATSVFSKARRAPAVRSKTKRINKLKTQLRILSRQRQSAYKKACKRIARKKRR
jgi:hypothetical protein